MNLIEVQIVRITDSAFPVWVECVLRDANGREWRFTDKAPVFTDQPVHEGMSLPQPGIIACELVREWIDELGCSRCLIDTRVPWGIEASDGETRFEVFKEHLRLESKPKVESIGTFRP